MEFKFELKKEFDHSFTHLEAIVCWNARVKDGEEVADLSGNKGTYHVTPQQDGTTNRFIVVPNSPRNVEVIVLRELLKTNGIEFVPRGG